MSVINQMLQDLEKRRAGASEGAGLPNQVRPLPDAPAASGRSLMLGAAIVTLVAAGAVSAWWIKTKTPATVANTVAQTATVPAPPAAQSAPAPTSKRAATTGPAAPTAATTPPSSHAPAGMAQRDTLARADGKGLRLSPSLSVHVPAAEKSAANPPAPARADTPIRAEAPARAESSVRAESPTRAEGPAHVDVAPKPRLNAAPGSIDKQPRPVTARERSDADYRRASDALGQGRAGDAEDALRAALAQDPSYDAPRQALVGLLIEQKRPADAQKLLQEALAARPDHLGFAMLLARLQLDRGDSAAAIATMSRGLPYAGDNAEFLGFSAALLQRAGRHAEAAEQYRAALRLKPDAAVWWMGLGISLQAAERGADALDAYRRALSSGSLSPELRAFVEQRIRQLTP